MSNIEGLNLFGKLTVKTSLIEQTGEINKQETEFVSSDEQISLIENANEYDTVELSTKKEDDETNINERNIILWEQEAKINSIVEELKPQVIKDFAGETPEDIVNVLSKINEYKTSFIENYPPENDISKMSEVFKEELSVEYEIIKEDAKNNTKSAIKDRVIETILDTIAEDVEKGGRQFLGIVQQGALTISDDAKKEITKELDKESEKFMKNYTGSNLEEDLMNYLMKFLSETDKEKLAGAIQKWEEDKTKIEQQDKNDKNRIRQMRESVKSFLVTALMLGIKVELGGTVIRTEVIIPQVLSKYEDVKSLQEALDSVIAQLSDKSRKDKYLEEKKPESKDNLFSFNSKVNNTNFFKL